MSNKKPKLKEVTSDVANDLFNKAKVVKGDSVIKILQKSDYEGCPVYIRMIGKDLFEYLLIYEGELYSGFNIIKPEKGKRKLNKDQIAQAGALIFTGAITTIDTLMGKDTPIAKTDKKKVN